jgi:hypothetical protein
MPSSAAKTSIASRLFIGREAFEAASEAESSARRRSPSAPGSYARSATAEGGSRKAAAAAVSAATVPLSRI